MNSLKFRPMSTAEKILSLLDVPIIMLILWLSAKMSPGDMMIDGIGTLIVASAVYFILSVLVMMLITFICGGLIGDHIKALLVSCLFALFSGIPVLFVLNFIISGFWIADLCSMTFVSLLGSMSIIGIRILLACLLH